MPGTASLQTKKQPGDHSSKETASEGNLQSPKTTPAKGQGHAATSHWQTLVRFQDPSLRPFPARCDYLGTQTRAGRGLILQAGKYTCCCSEASEVPYMVLPDP